MCVFWSSVYPYTFTEKKHDRNCLIPPLVHAWLASFITPLWWLPPTLHPPCSWEKKQTRKHLQLRSQPLLPASTAASKLCSILRITLCTAFWSFVYITEHILRQAQIPFECFSFALRGHRSALIHPLRNCLKRFFIFEISEVFLTLPFVQRQRLHSPSFVVKLHHYCCLPKGTLNYF